MPPIEDFLYVRTCVQNSACTIPFSYCEAGTMLFHVIDETKTQKGAYGLAVSKYQSQNLNTGFPEGKMHKTS